MKDLYESSLLSIAEKPLDIIWHPNSEKIAVIMDPRYDKLMVGVIKNFMQYLNPCGWNLVIITHEKYAVEFLYRRRFKMGHPVGVSFQIVTDTAPLMN